jgi:hypothetical protein
MSLKERLEKLSAFKTRNTMDGPVCEPCLTERGGGAAAPSAPPPPTAEGTEPPPN